MKVVVKKPGLKPEIIEVEGISEINKLVGNVNENGDGYNHGGTDIRQLIGENIDIYVNENALFNNELEGNLWSPNNNGLWCGAVVFAGYSKEDRAEAGAVSLTQEQIDYCLDYIDKQDYYLDLMTNKPNKKKERGGMKMSILNKKVLHENYGEGVIDKLSNKTFHVTYQSGKDAMYYYPDDLGPDGIVRLIDADEKVLKEINDAIKIKNGNLIINTINGIQKLGLPDTKTTKPTSLNPNKICRLKFGDCFDGAAKDIYSSLCNNTNFNWNTKCIGKFGGQQVLFAQNATPEGYSVWFIPYSSYTGSVSNTRDIYNNILDDSKDIEEYWINGAVFDCANSIGEKIVTFVKNKFGQYEFWGVMETEEVNANDKVAKQKYFSDTY